MPAVTTSTATGSRVLQKPMSSDAGRHSLESPAEDMKQAQSSSTVSQTSPSKRASNSSTMSSKIKRFPTLLSRKESRSKAEANGAGVGGARSVSNGEGRRKSLANDSQIPKPSTPQSHNRSVSLASATPSSLPRPVASAGLPSSATSPNLADIARGSSANQQQPSSPTTFGGSPKRVPIPGQESGIPRLVTSPRSRSGSPAASKAEAPGNEVETQQQQGINAQSQTSSAPPAEGIPSSDAANAASSGQPPGAAAGLTDGPTGDTVSNGNLYVVNGDASPDPARSDVTGLSESMSRTSSGSRIPMAMTKSSTKNSVPQSGTSPDSTVPAMWRSNSYEGSTQAYLATSQSGKNLSGHGGAAKSAGTQQPTLPKSPFAGHPTRAIGIEGLKRLASDPAVIGTPALQNRVHLLQQLVTLRGERVLTDVDVSEIVWAKGTDAQLTAEEEFSRARNGKAMSNVGSPVVTADADQSPASTNSPPKKAGLLDRVTARFGNGHKSHAPESSSSISLTDATEQGMPRSPALSDAPEQPALKRGPVFGTALQDIPPLAMAISIIGGQRHQLPILVFSLVEAIFKRGLDTSGIFRMNGNAAAVQRLVEVYNTWPSYGDDHSTDEETIFTLCEVLKKYLRDLPESLLSGALWTVFVYGCLADRGVNDDSEHYKRMAAVQIIFRLLPRKNMSLLIYLIAFLYQVSLRPANRLTTESISVIFGPSLIGTSRIEGQAANGINSSKASAEGLRWLLENWEDSLSQDLLDEDYDCFASPFVGQTAWSTPNILGESQGNPFNASSAETVQRPQASDDLLANSSRDGAALESAMNGSGKPSEGLPQSTAETYPALTEQPVDSSVDPQHPGDQSYSTVPSDIPTSPINKTSNNGTRSVSGFAKGEHFTDEDINADPNAAQLFGSLSQLFTTERRKVKAYQAEVEELQARQNALESSVASLQTALAQSNQRSASLDAEVASLKDQIKSLEEVSHRAANNSLQQQEILEATQRDLEKYKQDHANAVTQAEEARATFEQQHTRALEDQRATHMRQLEEHSDTLRQQQEQEKASQLEALSSKHQDELRRLQSEHDDEKARMVQEIQQLREAVQVSDKERDGAREHLQRIRALLDAAQ